MHTAYTFFCLGTDTQYTPDANYAMSSGAPPGLQETLSTVIQYVSTRESPSADQRSSSAASRGLSVSLNPESTSVISGSSSSSSSSSRIGELYEFSNQNSAIINGPKTFGEGKYEIISRSLVHLLEQMTKQSNLDIINLAGHSRGAVETIIIAHELQRIKDAIKSKDDCSVDELIEIIKQSPNEETKKILAGLSLELTDTERSNLIQNIKQLRVNIFAIDPVPGGSVHGVTVAQWVDDRYNRIPEIVSDYEQIIMEHERTRGFKTILPTCANPISTKYTVNTLPGHHGTATGNPYQQNIRNDNPQVITEVPTEVQEITIYNLHRFLSSHHTEFSQQFGKTEKMDIKLNEYIGEEISSKTLVEENRRKIRLLTYKTISDKKGYFERFRQTSYPILGKEQDIKQIFWKIKDSRIITSPDGGDLFLNEILQTCNSVFVNSDHIKLSASSIMARLTDLSASLNPRPPEEQLLTLMEKLREATPESEVAHTLSDTSFVNEVSSNLEALAMDLARTYLRNNISEESKAIILNQLSYICRNKAEGEADSEYVITPNSSKVDVRIEAEAGAGKSVSIQSTSMDEAPTNKIIKDLQNKLIQHFFNGIKTIIATQLEESLDFAIKLNEIKPTSGPINEDEDSTELNPNSFILQAYTNYERQSILIPKLRTLVTETTGNQELINQIKRLSIHMHLPYLCAMAMVKTNIHELPSDIQETEFGRVVMQSLHCGLLIEDSNEHKTTITQLKSEHVTNLQLAEQEFQSRSQELSGTTEQSIVSKQAELVAVNKKLKKYTQTIDNIRQNAQSLSGISYPILSGFIAALGITAVALALTVVGGGIPMIVLAVAGATLCAFGLFGSHHAIKTQAIQHTMESIAGSFDNGVQVKI